MSRTAAWLATLAALGTLGWLFPLFHFVPLKQTESNAMSAEFNASRYATAFWDDKLLKSLNRAADAEQVLAALSADPQRAREEYGRKLGFSHSTLFFLRGTGRIVSVKKNKVMLTLTDGDDAVDVVLPTGLLFGNAVRDGTGLLDASTFPNSQDFNDLSTALNRIVETTVLPPLREQAAVGATVSFTGCVEVDDEETDVRPLKIIPVAVQIEPQE